MKLDSDASIMKQFQIILAYVKYELTPSNFR